MYIDLNDRSIKVQLKNYNMDKLSKSIQKRVNFFWLTSSVFMDTCKRFYFHFNILINPVLVGHTTHWNGQKSQAQFKNFQCNGNFTIFFLSMMKSTGWKNLLEEKKKTRIKNINKQPNKSIWARHMNWWTRTTAPANVDDEICWVKMHSSSVSSKCQLVHAKLPSNQQFAMVIIKFLIH